MTDQELRTRLKRIDRNLDRIARALDVIVQDHVAQQQLSQAMSMAEYQRQQALSGVLRSSGEWIPPRYSWPERQP